MHECCEVYHAIFLLSLLIHLAGVDYTKSKDSRVANVYFCPPRKKVEIILEFLTVFLQ